MAPRRSSRGAAKAKSVDYSEMAYASPQCPLHFISPRRTGASYIGDWNHIKMAGGTAATPATPTPRTRRWRRRSRRSRGSRGNRRRTTARAAAAARRPALGAAARAARPCRCRAGPARRRRATSALLRWRGLKTAAQAESSCTTIMLHGPAAVSRRLAERLTTPTHRAIPTLPTLGVTAASSTRRAPGVGPERAHGCGESPRRHKRVCAAQASMQQEGKRAHFARSAAHRA